MNREFRITIFIAIGKSRREAVFIYLYWVWNKIGDTSQENLIHINSVCLVGLVHFVFQSRWRSVVIKDENGKFQCEKTGNIFRDCNDDPLQPSVHLPAGLGCILFEHFCRNF